MLFHIFLVHQAYTESPEFAAFALQLASLATPPPPPQDDMPLSVQIYWMMHRQYLLLSRSPSLTYGRILPTAVFSAIIGSLFWKIGDTQV
jgi:hypothetical protein